MSGHATPRPSHTGGEDLPVPAARSGGEGDLSSVLAAAVRGDQGAWREVVDRYARRVFALARSRVRSPELAEEVTQSVFATLASTLGSGGYAEQGRFESWLFRVTMNRVRDEVRRASHRAAPMDPASMPVGVSDPPTDRSPPSGLESLRRALADLPDPDREIIELRHHGQMSFKAMADLLGEPLGTLLARHHRALRKLRGLILGAESDVVAGDGQGDTLKEGVSPSPSAPRTIPIDSPGEADERGSRR